jgi:uncharacterized protein YycO
MRNVSMLLAALALATAATACNSKSVVVHKPTNPVVNDAVTAMWADEVRRVAQDGDWILTRSYSFVGDAIVAISSGEELSHGSVYDADREMIIEAITPSVRQMPLEHLLGRNRYVIVVRPTNVDGHKTVLRARSAIGKTFDTAGLFGLGKDDRFYCSELLYWASGLNDRDPQKIITPAELLQYGEVVYFSGRRDDPQMQRAALGWTEERASGTVVADGSIH